MTIIAQKLPTSDIIARLRQKTMTPEAIQMEAERKAKLEKADPKLKAVRETLDTISNQELMEDYRTATNEPDEYWDWLVHRYHWKRYRIICLHPDSAANREELLLVLDYEGQCEPDTFNRHWYPFNEVVDWFTANPHMTNDPERLSMLLTTDNANRYQENYDELHIAFKNPVDASFFKLRFL